MLIIDKANNTNQLIVTLSELTTSPNPQYELELFNFFTNVTYLWKGSSVNVISTNDRRDIIEIALDNEDGSKTLEEGQYKYIFYEVIDVNRVVVEKGLLKVTNSNSTSDNIYVIETQEDDDDYIVFTG